MAELDHWHPVVRSEELSDRPVRVRLCGRDIVVFRTEDQRVGALVDRCPHRAMRLSEGRVEGQHLVCPYHGWRWAPDGSGRSPANPKARPCAESFDAVERLGAVWVKNAWSTAAFPRFDVSGHHEIARLRHRVEAPLELVLDNFIEVEHTPTTHWLFGYAAGRLHEVVTEVRAESTEVYVYNRGPQKPMPFALRTLLGLGRDDHFVDEWTTYFSPVYTVYDQYFIDPKTDRSRPEILREAVFFNPVTADETELFTFVYAIQPPWGRFGLNMVLNPVLRRLADVEIQRDVDMLDRLADKRVSLHGNRLGRFDKALMAARDRIDRIYRGKQPQGSQSTA